MGDVVNIKSAPTKDDFEFVADLCRFREGLLDEKAIRKKYRLADEIWDQLGEDDSLIRAVEAESLRRVRDGSCKREKAQALVVKAPEVAASIMNDVEANAGTAWTPARCWTISVRMDRQLRRRETDS